MTDLTLQTTARNVLGKKTRFLRRRGITPVHLFGHGIESLPLQCDTASLQRIITRAGTTRLVTLEIEGRKQPTKVFIREIQSDPCTGTLVHVDLYQIRLKERMKADIPLVLTGEAPALKEKGRSLIYGITSLSIECLPDKVPPSIEIDLRSLAEVDQAIHVRDIVLDPDITVFTDAEQMVVKVSEVHEEILEEVAAEEEEVVEEVRAETKAEEETEPES